MKNRRFYFSNDVLAFLLIIIATSLLAILGKDHISEFYIVLMLAIALVFFFIVTVPNTTWSIRSAQILQQEANKIDAYINAAYLPTTITSVSGRIYWSNSAFLQIHNNFAVRKNVYKLFPNLARPNKDKSITIGNITYKIEKISTQFQGRDYFIFRFINEDVAIKATHMNQMLHPVVGYIQIDSYNELIQGISQVEHSELDVNIDRAISAWLEGKDALMLKYQSDKYVIAFEKMHLRKMQEERFKILDDVRSIMVPNGVSPTISIAIGCSSNHKRSDEFARKALELAQGRGGDQAIIKDKEGFSFYGGIQKAVQVKSKVRSRVMSKALRNLMEQYTNILILGHAVPDLDCLGSAMGICACARKIGKRPYIVLDKANVAIAAAVEEAKKLPEYQNTFISVSEAASMIDKQTMIVVVDTQNKSYVLASSLLDKVATVVVIDHHLKGTSSIENCALFYQEPYASSAAEMVTEIVQYFSENIKLLPLEAEALLAGITIDTKGFSFKTGVRTFDAASYLRRAGADTTSIRTLFQDDFETFAARSQVVRTAQIVHGCVAISQCPDNLPNKQLIAAQAADSLVGIKGIDASFVLSQNPNGVISISGRSIGGINVQLILERLGGGGHATIAGAQIKDKTIPEVIFMLITEIEKYFKEDTK